MGSWRWALGGGGLRAHRSHGGCQQGSYCGKQEGGCLEWANHRLWLFQTKPAASEWPLFWRRFGPIKALHAGIVESSLEVSPIASSPHPTPPAPSWLLLWESGFFLEFKPFEKPQEAESGRQLGTEKILRRESRPGPALLSWAQFFHQ